MKLIKLIPVLLFLFIGGSIFAQGSIPSVTVKKLSGETVNTLDLCKEKKLTIFSFWATWCSPCKRELDAISEIYGDWQEDYDVQLVAVTIDNARALPKVAPLVAAKGWDYTILSDVKEVFKRAMNIQSVPHTFVADQNGNIIYTHSGYSPGDEYELEDLLKASSGK